MERKDRYIRRKSSRLLPRCCVLASLGLLPLLACRAQAPLPAAAKAPCASPVLVKGYYVIAFHAADIQNARQRVVNKAGNVPFDMPTIEGFIPQDSITPKRPLAANLAGLFACGNNTAYILPESDHFITYYCHDAGQVNSLRTAIPQRFTLENLVMPKNTSAEAYKLYYVEGLWAKFEINNSPAERRLTENAVARQCASGPGKKFTIICCLNILTSTPYKPLEGVEFVAF